MADRDEVIRPIVDERIKQWATARQSEYISAALAHGSFRAASRALGVEGDVVRRGILAAEKRAASMGYHPDSLMVVPTTAPFRIRGISTNVPLPGGGSQWIKTERDPDLSHEMLQEFVEWLATQEVVGRAPLIKAPKPSFKDLLNVFPMGDPHFGMYAWAAEAGSDFNLDIAERLTSTAIDHLVSVSPKADTALLLNLGDMFHADDSTNMTPRSKHILDVSGRWGEIVQVGKRAMVRQINRLLETHRKVIVWIVPGNHDPHLAPMLAIVLDAWFRNEPRVEINTDPGLYKYMRWGKTLIGAHHGHGAKMQDLGLIMASDCAQDWGLTTDRYFFMGHIHHKHVDKEQRGVMVESFNTLAPADAHHRGAGYRAKRDMRVITMHAERGELVRHRFDAAWVDL